MAEKAVYGCDSTTVLCFWTDCAHRNPPASPARHHPAVARPAWPTAIGLDPARSPLVAGKGDVMSIKELEAKLNRRLQEVRKGYAVKNLNKQAQ